MKLFDRLLGLLGLARASVVQGSAAEIGEQCQSRAEDGESLHDEVPPKPLPGIAHNFRSAETLNGVDMAILGQMTNIMEPAPGQVIEQETRGYMTLADGSIVTSISDTPCSLCYVCLQQAQAMLGGQGPQHAIFPRALWPTDSTVVDHTGRRLCLQHAVHVGDDPRTGMPIYMSVIEYELLQAQQGRPILARVKNLLLGE